MYVLYIVSQLGLDTSDNYLGVQDTRYNIISHPFEYHS